MQNLHADIALEVSPESLVDLIESRSRYSDLHGWMRLADCVAQALLVLRNGDDIQRLAPLAAAVAELDRVKKIKSPRWVGDMLARAVEEWTETPKVAATEMVIPSSPSNSSKATPPSAKSRSHHPRKLPPLPRRHRHSRRPPPPPPLPRLLSESPLTWSARPPACAYRPPRVQHGAQDVPACGAQVRTNLLPTLRTKTDNHGNTATNICRMAFLAQISG